jgi:hypothetical protein
MNALHTLALALISLSATSVTLANAPGDSVYGAGFTLSNTPNLKVGSSIMDEGRDTVGSWTSGNNANATVNLREMTDSGWGPSMRSENIHRAGGFPLGMGDTNAFAGSGSAGVTTKSLGATVRDNAGSTLEGTTVAEWSRNFSIDAHASFTFSGTASLTFAGQKLFPGLGQDIFASTGSSSYNFLQASDATHTVETRLSAYLDSYDADAVIGVKGTQIKEQFFSFTTNKQTGEMSLTINNIGNTALTGTLGINSTVSMTSAVPEPSTYLSMLLGLGIVGAMTRRKATQAGELALA